MKRLVKKRFRCDLCGKFKDAGVTETDPRDPTYVCFGCIGDAAEVMCSDVRDTVGKG